MINNSNFIKKPLKVTACIFLKKDPITFEKIVLLQYLKR